MLGSALRERLASVGDTLRDINLAEFGTRTGFVVLSQLHVIAPVHGESAFSTAVQNAAVARGSAVVGVALYGVVKNALDVGSVLDGMGSGPDAPEPPEVEYRPDPSPLPAPAAAPAELPR